MYISDKIKKNIAQNYYQWTTTLFLPVAIVKLNNNDIRFKFYL